MTDTEKQKWVAFIQRGLRQNVPPHPRHATAPAPEGLSMEEYEALYLEATKDYPSSVFMNDAEERRFRAGKTDWWND